MEPLHSYLDSATQSPGSPSSLHTSPELRSRFIHSRSNSSDAFTPERDVSPMPFRAGRGRSTCSSMTQSSVRVNFAPFEDLDDPTSREVSKFVVGSLGDIAKNPGSIPYSSAKKDFYDKTGLETLQVFRYDFRIPGVEKLHTVWWDYHVGLVRITPFFKCLGYGKTTPKTVLRRNKDLETLCPNITGGSIAAQGYWMPYHCAKAVCRTFCYEIAGALVPVFGPTFLKDCILPGTSGFESFEIDPALIVQAKNEVDAFCSRLPSIIPSGEYMSGDRFPPNGGALLYQDGVKGGQTYTGEKITSKSHWNGRLPPFEHLSRLSTPELAPSPPLLRSLSSRASGTQLIRTEGGGFLVTPDASPQDRVIDHEFSSDDESKDQRSSGVTLPSFAMFDSAPRDLGSRGRRRGKTIPRSHPNLWQASGPMSHRHGSTDIFSPSRQGGGEGLKRKASTQHSVEAARTLLDMRNDPGICRRCKRSMDMSAI